MEPGLGWPWGRIDCKPNHTTMLDIKPHFREMRPITPIDIQSICTTIDTGPHTKHVSYRSTLTHYRCIYTFYSLATFIRSFIQQIEDASSTNFQNSVLKIKILLRKKPLTFQIFVVLDVLLVFISAQTTDNCKMSVYRCKEAVTNE